MESGSRISNEDNCSSSDSCFDMDVDNTEEHKEQNIYKQEQIAWKHFLTILTMIKIRQNAEQIYKTRKLSWSERKARTVFDDDKIFREFHEDNRKSQSRSRRKIEDDHVKYILSEVDKNGSLSGKFFERH